MRKKSSFPAILNKAWPHFVKAVGLALDGGAHNMLCYKLIDIESLVLSAQQFITIIRMYLNSL